MAGFGVVAALVGCSGSAVIDDPGGSIGGRGNDAGASATAGRAGVGGSGVGGSGVGGYSGSSSAGSPGKGGEAGAAGSGGVCVNGTTKTDACGGCECIAGQWACTECPVKACGGFIGSTCSATEYCAYVPGQACGAADASSACKPRPDGCTDIYMPVCGCDQKTYASTCDAALHGQGVYTEGVCPPRP